MTKADKEGQRKAPILRFKGFTDDWEQRKPSDYLKESKIPGGNGEGTKKLTVKLWGKGVTKKETIYQGSSNTQYYIRKSGQLIYGKLDFLHAAFGLVPKELDGYESTIDSPSFDVLHGDSEFLLNYFLRKDFYLKNGKRANGSRKAKRINQKTFLNMIIYCPSQIEQSKISGILSKINNLITLYDRKTKLIKQIQSSFLDQFFSEAINVTSLNHFLKIRNGYAFKSSELTENGEIPVVKISNIGNDKPFAFTTETKNKEHFILYPNDIVIALSGATAGKINQVSNKYPIYYQNQRVGFFERKNDKLDYEYLNSFLHSKKFRSQLQKTLVAGAQPNIAPKDIEKIKIPFLEYELQQTIGQANKDLFRLQNLNKRKLTVLNRIKTTLLNTMFI